MTIGNNTGDSSKDQSFRRLNQRWRKDRNYRPVPNHTIYNFSAEHSKYFQTLEVWMREMDLLRREIRRYQQGREEYLREIQRLRKRVDDHEARLTAAGL